MSKTYGFKVLVVTTHELNVIAKAPDIHAATDAVDEFARKNLDQLLGERAVFAGRQVETYASRALEVQGNGIKVDVEV